MNEPRLASSNFLRDDSGHPGEDQLSNLSFQHGQVWGPPEKLLQQEEQWVTQVQINGGEDDTAEAKKSILRSCGVHVVDSPAEIGKKMAEVLGVTA